MPAAPQRTFYGWWIVAAAFLNLFFAVGVIFYGFPVLYPSLTQHLGFTRAQVTQGFLIGFAGVGPIFGFLAGALIDRVGARWVIFVGAGLAGTALILMGFMTRLWQYEVLCSAEVLGYVLAGPIPNQVLVANWFRAQRGRAMGYAYLGLGLGGVVSPPLLNALITSFGWRRAIQAVGFAVLLVLGPVAVWVTRSTPAELHLLPDGAIEAEQIESSADAEGEAAGLTSRAVRTLNFWLIVIGCTLVIGTIGGVIQHFILFLRDQGYSARAAAQCSSGLLLSSLAGRVCVGYIADRFPKKDVMALFYLVLGMSVPLLYGAEHPAAAWTFALVFGFAMGADYMLIPLMAAECFGLRALGKLLGLIIMGYSLGQWFAPWLAGRIYDVRHSYDLAWAILTAAGVLGAAAVYCISPRRRGIVLCSPGL